MFIYQAVLEGLANVAATWSLIKDMTVMNCAVTVTGTV
ncbi:hypothetical protein CZ787_15640 [Halomonas citrativorans]|uniref:Uncharacterized protein n=1 Tax=Halomonas citrativorans TaxID=2742612 RepID=A0A1R4I3U8_9GAMM|nr:hypothetical protein CZ787_15640 [Halomonas citrativorans]